MKRKHLISDFDGVIGNTLKMNWTLVQYLHRDVKYEEYLIDHHLGNVYEQPKVPFTPESTERYRKLYGEHLSFEHVADALMSVEQLAQTYHFHIVTSNSEVAIKRVLNEAGILSQIGQVLGEETHWSKVEKFTRLFKDESFSAADSLYITDTVGDLKEAKKVGLRSIAVTFGYHPRELLEAHQPEALARSWEEVCLLVEQMMI